MNGISTWTSDDVDMCITVLHMVESDFRRESGAGLASMETFTLVFWVTMGWRFEEVQLPLLYAVQCTVFRDEMLRERSPVLAACVPGEPRAIVRLAGVAGEPADFDRAPSHLLLRLVADHDRRVGSDSVAVEAGPKSRCDDRGAQSAGSSARPHLQLWRLLVAPQSTRGPRTELHGLRHCRS
jgi:hypothetical protein